MDLKDQPESIQHAITFDEDITEKRQIIRLPVQQAVLVVQEREQKSSLTNLTDAHWQQIAPLLPPITANGHQHKVEPREVVNGILYIVCGSHDWRSFPPELPPRGTVYAYYRQWQRDGTLQRILDALCSEEGEAAGREEPAGAVPGDAVAGEPQSGAAYDLTVVIPTRNERDNILPLLQALRAALDGMRAEMIFVDDSDDDTPEVIKNASAMETSMFHVQLEHRQQGSARAGGLATAVVHGMNRAQAEYVAVIDADLQHPPEQLRALYDQAVAQHADLVLASRYIKGGSYRGLAGVGRRWISIGLKWTAKLLFPGHLRRVSDPLGGFFLLRRALLADVSLRPIGYKILLEILLRCPWRHVLEVPYQFQARAAGQSKATMRQGILALQHMLRLWREVPAAGRVWKISLLVLLNVLIILALFILHKSFPLLWAPLSMVIFGMMACLDFVLFKRFLFPSPNKASLQAIAIPTTPIVEANTDGQFEVMRYAEWLAAEAKRTNNSSHQEESKKYAEDALKTVTLNGQEFRPFAPFRHALSAYKTLTRGQAVVLSIIIFGCGLGLLFFGIKLVIAFIAIITFLYFGSLFLDFLLAMRTLNQSTDEQIDEAVVHALADAEWPQYTILCPLYREVEVVPQFVQAMQALDYPADKLQILFLTEEDDVETRKAIAAMHLPHHFSIVTVPDGQPRTKPRACNFGLLQATGDYVVIYDAEDIPDPLQLKKAVLAFANHDADLACVQAKLNYYNTKQNLLTRWFTVEYCLWFDLMLPGMQQMKLPLPLGGTSNHFRMEMLRKVGAWDPFNVTEDCDLGLRLARSGLKTIVLDSTTYEEANSQVKNWIRQRSRWIKGYLLTYLVYMRQPLRYLLQGRLREFLSLQLVIGGKTAVLFVNPLVWALLVVYILFRPIAVYHTLFPAPVLYMGILCLIFGNFFYTYMNLIGCMKLSRYGLIKWALSIPIYWMMMTVAASLALYQLIFKPHYWEKTKHGLHLHTSGLSAASTTVEEEPESMATMQLPAFTSTKHMSLPLPAYGSSSGSTAVTKDLKSKVPTPLAAFRSAGHLSVHLPKRRARQQRVKDPWLLATFVVACFVSSAACWYFFQHHQILLYDDAISHLRIARRVFDNTTPGFAQLGGVWLPLPHVLMLPFIWNYYLWRTGLAGSFSSMLCYVVAVVYLFLAARRLTHDSRASFVGTLLFIVNPNVLYLQSTPLSELVCVATALMACYYFLAWAQDDHPKYLVGMAAGTFLATLSRYDGWGLFLILLVLLMIVGLIKRQRWVQIEGTLLIFGSLGSLGIGLWILWDGVILGDPLYWHHYLYGGDLATQYYTYHNLLQSISAYMVLSLETVGPILCVLAAIAVVGFVFRHHLTPTMFGGVAFLAPFAFYILIFYTGQDTIFLPGIGPATTWHYLWNVRFGVQAVAPVALFIAILAKHWSNTKLARLWTLIRQIVLVIVIGIQTMLTASGGIISLQDGLYGASCLPTERITIYLAQHYAGGRILEDVNAFPINEAYIGIDLKDAIYEGSGELWKKALNDPASVVDWIIAQPRIPNDLITTRIDLKSPKFLSQFTLVFQQGDGLTLYHRKGRPPLPTRPIPSSLITDNRLCGTT